ncbi:hypothetical protein BH11MYX2_BH11MYX2_16380 [soil metagenome]
MVGGKATVIATGLAGLVSVAVASDGTIVAISSDRTVRIAKP